MIDCLWSCLVGCLRMLNFACFLVDGLVFTSV